MSGIDYGTTFAFMTMDNKLSLLSGVNAVADDLIGRLSMKLWYSPNFGTIVENLVNSTTKSPNKTAQDTCNAVQSELMKDERVASVQGKITKNNSTPTSVDVELTFNVVLSNESSFTLIGNINSIDTSKWSWF